MILPFRTGPHETQQQETGNRCNDAGGGREADASPPPALKCGGGGGGVHGPVAEVVDKPYARTVVGEGSSTNQNSTAAYPLATQARLERLEPAILFRLAVETAVDQQGRADPGDPVESKERERNRYRQDRPNLFFIILILLELCCMRVMM